MHFKITILLFLFSLQLFFAQGLVPSNEIDKATALMKTDNISNQDIVNALKLTLVFGLNDAIKGLGKKNGFYKDSSVHIELPPNLQQLVDANNDIKNSLKKALDKAINRVAEESMGKAKPIFKAQLDKLKFLNALNDLLSKEDQATQYFEEQATPAITKKLKPVIQKLLDNSDVPDTINQILSQLKDSTGISVDGDLTDYVTQKTIQGVFQKMADNEQKMKAGETLRTTLLLKAVFDLRDKVVR